MLSNTCKYAIRGVIYLAVKGADGQKISIKKIAEDLDVSPTFLGKIMKVLAKRGILLSWKGPNGGFSLKKKPDEISLIDIVEIIDGRKVFDECLLGLRICKGKDELKYLCPFHKKSKPVRQALLNTFQNTTIAEFVNHDADFDLDI